MRKYIQKRFILALIVSCVITAAVAPFFYKNLFTSIRSTNDNRIARIDVFNFGGSENTIEFIDPPKNVNVTFPSWCQKCASLEASITDTWTPFKIRFKAIKDGKILISLKGPCKRIDNIPYPVWVDYKNTSVNHEKIIDKETPIWHDAAYNHDFMVKDGDIIELELDAKKHPFRPMDLAFYHLNFWILFSIFVLSFLFSYKVVNYLARFKLLEKHSRIDIVFLTLFFGLLWLPMLHISHAERSDQEKRLLAPMTELIADGNINNKFGEQFNNWFNDRFWGRDFVISLFSRFSFKINRHYSSGKLGLHKDGWMIDNASMMSSTFSEDDLVTINDGIKHYLKFCDEQHIKCYLMIVPRRVEFARDKFFRIIPDEETDRSKALTEYVKEKQNFDIPYPLDAMKEANRTEYVFFKTDHHWTDWGTFIGYQALMSKIKQDFPDLKILEEKDFDITYDNRVRSEAGHNFFEGVSCQRLNLSVKDCPLQTPYKYYRHKQEDNLKVAWDLETTGKDFVAEYAPNKQTVMLIGNSFSENFSYFLASSFKKVLKRRTNQARVDNFKLSRWKDEMIKTHPDIVIIVINSENAHQLKDLKE